MSATIEMDGATYRKEEGGRPLPREKLERMVASRATARQIHQLEDGQFRTHWLGCLDRTGIMHDGEFRHPTRAAAIQAARDAKRRIRAMLAPPADPRTETEGA